MRKPAGLIRRMTATATLLALACSASMAVTSQAAAAVVTSHGSAAQPPHHVALLTASQAVNRARATRRAVVVTSLTTPMTMTTANPNGTLTLRQSLLPSRILRNGTWVPVSGRLTRNGSRLVAASAASPVSVSAGGSGPLATMYDAGRTLSLSWPGTLPAPLVSGATATYAGVLPGVDLAVTTDPQGGVSDTLIVQNAAAAANPALAGLALNLATSPGLTVTKDAAGNVTVGSPGAAQPAFTALAPKMWDSTPPPAGTATVTGSDGIVRGAQSGLPAYSSVSEAGAWAHVTTVPVTVTGTGVTLSPATSALTGPGVTYPVYIDPTWVKTTPHSDATAWAQVDSGNPGSNYYKQSGDLQLGYCGYSGCNGIGVVRAYFTVPVSTSLSSSTGTSINYSKVYMTDDWAASCTHEKVDLSATKAISSSTTWNNQPTVTSSKFTNQSFAQQNPAENPSTTCKAVTDGIVWTVTNIINGDLGKASSQTFMMQADDENQDSTGALYWKQFLSGGSKIYMITNYDFYPNPPSSLLANGHCGTSGTPSLIGLDSLSISANASDPDGDKTLNTAFTIYNSDNTTAASSTVKSSTSPSATWAQATVSGWHSGAYTYHVTAVTTDQAGLVSKSNPTCYFTYDPTIPGPPDFTSVSPASAVIGSQVTATIAAPAGCGSSNPCPAQYIVQVGSAAPQAVSVNGTTCTTASCPVPVTITQVGPVTITVTGITAAGNEGQSNTAEVQGTAPATPYADGHFLNGPNPDLLTLGANPKAPSLWLSAGTGTGAVGGPADIGELGTGVNPGTDGPADWANSQGQPLTGYPFGGAIHGNFAGNGVQDVMAYYPNGTDGKGTSAGEAVIVPSTGAGTLQADPASDKAIASGAWYDPNFGDSASVPVSLVAAGNASQCGEPQPDLIGAYGDAASGYELALFVTDGTETGYDNYSGQPYQLAGPGTSPDGSPWNDFSYATAEAAGNPSAVVLFALDTAKGNLYESSVAAPGACPATFSAAGTGTGPYIGQAGTWTLLTVSPTWGSTPPDLASADYNSAGQIELWTINSAWTTATPYDLNTATSTVTAGAGSPLDPPSHDWPLSDGGCSGGTTPNTATDTITAGGTNSASSISGGYTWGCDDSFNFLTLDGSTGCVTSASTDPSLNTTASYTVGGWARLDSTTTVQTIISQDGTNASAFKLQFSSSAGTWTFTLPDSDTTNPTQTVVNSSSPATPGAWTYVVGVYNSSAKTAQLYVNGVLKGTATNVTARWASTGRTTIGRTKWNGANANFFDGDLSGIEVWPYALTAAQIAALYQ